MTNGEGFTAQPTEAGMRPDDSERRSFGNALKWSYVMDGGGQVATMAITFVLAGILGPAAFGTVAMATVYIVFVQMLLQQGMVPAVIQRRSLKSEHLDSAFWMIMGTSIVLTACSIALSGWWASVNRLPDLRAVIVVLSLLIPIKGLVLVQDGLLRRELNFRLLALRTNASVVAGGVAGLALAFNGFGVWSLVAQQIVTGVVGLVIIWRVSQWRPSASFSVPCARDLLGFSASSSLATFGIFVNTRADALLIGLLFGPTAVGLYRFATRLVDMLIDTTVRSLQAVALPELSRLQGNGEEFSARLLGMLWLSSIIALPALGILSASSDALMAVVGSEWIAASAPLKVLCLVGAVRALTFFNGPMLQAIGRPQYLAALVWAAAVLSISAFVLAGLLFRNSSIDVQILGISGSRLILYAGVFFAVSMSILIKIGQLAPSQLLRTISPAAGAAVAAMVAEECFKVLPLVADWNAISLLSGTVATGILTATAVLALTDRRLRGLANQHWHWLGSHSRLKADISENGRPAMRAEHHR